MVALGPYVVLSREDWNKVGIVECSRIGYNLLETFSKLFLLIVYIWVFCLCVYLYITSMIGAHVSHHI